MVCSTDSAPTSSTKKKKQKSTKDAMQLINTDRQGVWKQLRKLQKAHKKDVVEKRKTKKFKSAIGMLPCVRSPAICYFSLWKFIII